MHHSDEVLSLLRSYAEEKGYSFKLGSLGNNKIDSKYIYKGIELTVWFQHDKPSKKYTFGFDMFQGGSKVFTDFEEFKTLVSIYLHINGDIIPIAKNIADVFEKTLSVNSVYKTFKGNQEQGYVIIFNVLNDNNNEIRVKMVSNDKYVAQLTEYSKESEGKVNVISEKYYSVDDVGNITAVPVIADYIDELFSRYGDSDTINIRRYAQDSFEFDIHSKVHINATITVDDVNFVYIIHSAVDSNGKEYIENGDTRIILKDSTDLEELKDYFIKKPEVSSMSDLIDERKSGIPEVVSMEEVFDEFEDSTNEGVEEVFEEESVSEDISDKEVGDLVDEVVNEAVDGLVDDIVNTKVDEIVDDIVDKAVDEVVNEAVDTKVDEIVSETATEEVDTKVDEIVSETATEEVEEPTVEKISNCKEEVESMDKDSDSIEVKLVKESGVLKDVRFSYPDKILDVNIEVAKGLGLPVNRISTVISRESKRGMLITEEEISKRVFAQDISEDIDFCKSLVFDFFM